AATTSGGALTFVTGTNFNGSAVVKTFSSRDGYLPHSFSAYDRSFLGGGVFVAAGDVNGDGISDVVTGAGIYGPAVVHTVYGTNLSAMSTYTVYGDNAVAV